MRTVLSTGMAPAVSAGPLRADAGGMTDDFPELHRDLLGFQGGVITPRQARAAGLSDKAIVSRLRSGRWQKLHTGVYATFSGVPPRDAMLWAAVLRAGRRSVLSHQTAAELHGLLETPAQLIHVSVPSGSRVVRPEGVMIHYSGRLDQARHPVLAPPRTRIEDCVLDLVDAAVAVDEAASIILRAVGSRRTTAERIVAAMDQRPRLRWRRHALAALGAAAEGAHSLLEYRYITRVEGPHGLPRGRRQRPVRGVRHREYQDIAYEDYALTVELDGRAAHPLESRWRDVHRDNANVARGQVTIRLGYADVSAYPCASADVVGRALMSRGWTGVPRRCGRSCQLPETNR